jgi:predicted transcriptional regulator
MPFSKELTTTKENKLTFPVAREAELVAVAATRLNENMKRIIIILADPKADRSGKGIAEALDTTDRQIRREMQLLKTLTLIERGVGGYCLTEKGRDVAKLLTP